MKYSFLVARFAGLSIFLLMLSHLAVAQQRLPPKQMTYIATNKPNSIFYNDTIYTGSAEFRRLFYRTRDPQLIELYQIHQFNKVTGSVLGSVGTVALSLGALYASGNHKAISRSGGWVMAGSGLVAAITGGYLLNRGTGNLILATRVFNKRYALPSAAIGISDNGVGLVMKL
ncbi:hypothetical protein [Parasediminibacterium sp. JCM 36343]|uniref:hypothetical protein n=1 Tax=Parasediminibacterium sp. JCM 36343 TaxID=3374279 RepID=UPI00397C37BA